MVTTVVVFWTTLQLQNCFYLIKQQTVFIMEGTTDDRLPIVSDEITEHDDEERVISDSVEPTGLPEIKVFKRRWYILGVFCLLACHQCIVWNTFGPIESSLIYAYNWTSFEAPMMANWGCIMYVTTGCLIKRFLFHLSK